MQNFQNILKDLEPDLRIIDNTILEFAQGKSPLIEEISKHLISSGGKRIRPILLILSAQLCGKKSGHDLAAAVELIHSATLLHDDVVDKSEVRRGKKTANALWDNKASILVGDYLFSVAFQLMVRGKNLRILDLLAKASSTMADGEVMQLQNSNDVSLSKEKYLEIIFGKTAVLFSAACECGALVNSRPEDEISRLSAFGRNLGMVFQIVDDVLDYSSKADVLGKNVGDDFFEGKVTLPIILTYEKSTSDEKKLIEKIFADNFVSDKKNQDYFDKIMALITKYDGLQASKNLALSHKEAAINSLEIFPNSSAKDALIDVLNHSFLRIS